MGALARIDIPQSVVATLGSTTYDNLHSPGRHNLLHTAPRLIDNRFSFTARSRGVKYHGIKG